MNRDLLDVMDYGNVAPQSPADAPRFAADFHAVVAAAFYSLVGRSDKSHNA